MPPAPPSSAAHSPRCMWLPPPLRWWWYARCCVCACAPSSSPAAPCSVPVLPRSSPDRVVPPGGTHSRAACVSKLARTWAGSTPLNPASSPPIEDTAAELAASQSSPATVPPPEAPCHPACAGAAPNWLGNRVAWAAAAPGTAAVLLSTPQEAPPRSTNPKRGLLAPAAAPGCAQSAAAREVPAGAAGAEEDAATGSPGTNSAAPGCSVVGACGCCASRSSADVAEEVAEEACWLTPWSPTPWWAAYAPAAAPGMPHTPDAPRP
mmetsp:Transcript_12831/g.31472  ORF Transcript_12831/g.31472 Transcript_12831/m.31472 type:complete len:264 (+) Transcript_12831:683-1474(+)